jgi:hypothetical protein
VAGFAPAETAARARVELPASADEAVLGSKHRTERAPAPASPAQSERSLVPEKSTARRARSVRWVKFGRSPQFQRFSKKKAHFWHWKPSEIILVKNRYSSHHEPWRRMSIDAGPNGLKS